MSSRRRPLLLLAMLLASTLLGSASAEGDAPAAPAFGVLANATVSCSAAWPSTTVGCFVERPALVLGGLELAVGVDAQALLSGALDDAHLAPYGILAYYADTWSAWLELRLPELAPVIGNPEYLRVGFSLRIPP